MRKYRPGVYHVVMFDKYGVRQSAQIADTFLEAQQKRDDAIASGAQSGAVLRVLSNTLDTSNAWDATEEDVARCQ